MRLFLILVVTFSSLKSFAITLQFKKDVLFPTGFKVKDTILGGLSGLSCNENKIYAVSDDRGYNSGARIFTFNLQLEKDIKITPYNSFPIKNSQGYKLDQGMFDFEGIVKKGKDFYAVNEGIQSSLKTNQSKLYKINSKGNFSFEYPLPTEWNFNKTSGIRENTSLESLTISPAKDLLLLGTENPLKQDDSPPTFNKSVFNRLISFNLDKKKFEKSYFYPLSPIPNPNDGKKVKADIGLVDLTWTEENKILALERSWISSHRKVLIRVFEFDLQSASKKDLKSKKLVLNLDSIINKLKTSKTLGNFESMCLGPKFPNGNSSLIMVTDNNFNKVQKTLFLVFEIKKD